MRPEISSSAIMSFPTSYKPSANTIKWEDSIKCDFEELIGKTLVKVERSKKNDGGDQIEFDVDDGSSYRLYHEQDCCESVLIEDIIGDLSDLVDSPILKASEDTNADDPGPLDEIDDYHTWTFYNIATIKGTVTLRWYGTSNGYYSESVDFARIVKKGEGELL